MADSFRRTGVEVIVKGLKPFLNDINKMNQAYRGMGKQAEKAFAGLQRAQKKLQQSQARSLRAQRAEERAIVALLRKYKQLERVKDKARRLEEAYKAVQKELAAGKLDQADATKALELIEKAHQDVLEKLVETTLDYQLGVDKLSDTQETYLDSLEDVKNKEQDVEKAQQAYINSLSLLAGVAPEVAAALGGMGVALGILGAAFLAAVKVAHIFISAMVKLAQVIASALVSAVRAAIGIFKTFISTIHKVIQAVLRLVSTIASKLGGAFKKAVGGVLGFLRDIAAVAGGVLLGNAISNFTNRISEMSSEIVGAVANFQSLEMRLQTLVAREIRAADATLSMEKSFQMASKQSSELLEWIKAMSLIAPIDVEHIAKVTAFSLAMGFTTEQAKVLTEAVGDYTSAMGLSSEFMERIIFNFGQMKASGKVTGTEMRDLARGAFFPLTAVLDRAAEKLGIGAEGLQEFRKAAAEGAIDINTFFEAFVELVRDEFPGSMERMGRTINGVIVRLKNFFKTVIGLEVLGPILGKIGERAADALDNLMSEDNIAQARILGYALGKAFDVIAAGVDNAVEGLKRFASALGILPKSGNFLIEFVAQASFAFRTLASLFAQVLVLISSHIKKTGTETAKEGYGWGYNMVRAIAEGMAKAIALIVQVINAISSLLASWFESKSPPKIAPEIDKWGADMMNEFLMGMTLADFTILEDVQGILQEVMQRMVDDLLITVGDATETFRQLSKDIAEALTSGVFDSDVLELLRSAAGEYGDELVELVNRHLELAESISAVEDAEQALDDARNRHEAASSKVTELIRDYNAALRAGAGAASLAARREEINAQLQARDTAAEEAEAAEDALDASKEQLDVIRDMVSEQQKLIQQMLFLSSVLFRAPDEDETGEDGIALPGIPGLDEGWPDIPGLPELPPLISGGQWTAALEEIEEAATGAGEAVGELEEGFSDLESTISGLDLDIDEELLEIDNLFEELDGQFQTLQAELLVMFTELLGPEGELVGNWEEAITNFEIAGDGFFGEGGWLETKWNALTGIWDGLFGPEGAITQTWESTFGEGGSLGQGIVTLAETTLPNYFGEGSVARGAIEGFGEVVDAIPTAFQQIATDMGEGSTFAQALKNVKTDSEGLDEALDGIADALERITKFTTDVNGWLTLMDTVIDVNIAQNLSDMSTAFGDMATAWGDLTGQDMGPSKTFLQFLVGSITAFFINRIENFGKAIAGVTIIFENITEAIESMGAFKDRLIELYDAINNLMTLDGEGGGGIAEAVGAVVTGIVGVMKGMLNAVIEVITGPIETIVGLIVGAFADIQTGAETMSTELVGQSIIPQMMTDIVTAFTTGIANILEAVDFTEITSAFETGATAVTTAVSTALSDSETGLKAAFSTALDDVRDYLNTTAFVGIESSVKAAIGGRGASSYSARTSGIAGAVTEGMEDVYDAWVDGWKELPGGIEEGMTELPTAVEDALGLPLTTVIETQLDEAVKVVKSYRTAFFNAGVVLAKGLAAGILSMAAEIAAAAAAIVRGAIDAAKAEMASGSPSRVMIEVGEEFVEGAKVGVLSMIPRMEEAGGALMQALADGIRSKKDLPSEATDEAMESIMNIAGGFSGLGSAASNRFKDTILDPMRDAYGDMEDKVEDLQDRFDELLDLQDDYRDQIEDMNKLLDDDDLSAEDRAKIMERIAILQALISDASRELWYIDRDRLVTLDDMEDAYAEIVKEQEKLARLQQAQADLKFLEEQWKFLQMLRDEGFSAKEIEDILGGIKLGVDADVEKLILAMTEAMERLVDEAEAELGISSPSTVFRAMGENLIEGLSEAFREEDFLRIAESVEEMAIRVADSFSVVSSEIMRATMAMTQFAEVASVVGVSPVSPVPQVSNSVNVNVNMGGVNISNGMDEAMFEARVTQIVNRNLRGY